MFSFFKKIIKSEPKSGQLPIDSNAEQSIDSNKPKETFLDNFPENDITKESEKNYDPILELKKYEYPSIDLVENQIVKNCLNQFKEIEPNLRLPLIWSFDDIVFVCKDLQELKNILITGTQATGKTTFLYQSIISLLFKKHPSQLKLILADCKGVEFNSYRLIEKYFLINVDDDNEPIIKNNKKFIYTLNALCEEMGQRYDYLKQSDCRNINEYNEKFIKRKLNPELGHKFLPFIVLIIDDLSGFMYSDQREIIKPIERLIKDGYKVGMFNIISTSQFTSDHLSGNLLSLIGQRVIFRLNTKEDYRKFFDTVKFDRFIKEGEFLYNEGAHIHKANCLEIQKSEIDSICEFIGMQTEIISPYILPRYENAKELQEKEFDKNDKDELFEEAARLIVQNQIGSASLIQRRMKLGYNRAGRLIDQLEAAGIVGRNLGSSARDVLIKNEYELEKFLKTIS